MRRRAAARDHLNEPTTAATPPRQAIHTIHTIPAIKGCGGGAGDI
jgi:hypothetical protein